MRVRRQDSSIENVQLMDELMKFLDQEMPDAVHKYKAYPQSFEYNQKALKGIQGFPEEAKARFSRPAQGGPRDSEQILKEQWRQRALGDSSEAKTFRALETLFQSRPALLLSGVKVEGLLQVARQAAKYSLGQTRKQSPQLFSVPLTKEERMLAEALGFDLSLLEMQINDLLALTPTTPLISRNGLLAALKSKTVRLGFHLLNDTEKSQYAQTMSKEVIRMFSKSNRDLSKDEVANYLSRFLLTIIEKKDEFDFLVADRDSSTFFQVEVKSYPQDGLLDKDGLEKALKKANEQLEKGDKFFQNVLAPAAQLSSSWKKINLVCFPKIPSRQVLRNLGMDEDSLKFVLTAEELKPDNLMTM